MNLDEQRIRELAYQIWESEGCPEGGAQRHWQMARKLLEAELQAQSPAAPAPRVRRTNTARATLTTAAAPASTPTAAKKPAAPKKPKAAIQAQKPAPDAEPAG
ncbi:DUF2934 domain-containing protein [Pseudomonas sp. GCM10022188]|uniref:DUF2934 domain-containing protein n=1 Tax=Pseudomonas TaxID=286 RepID=UPI001E54A9B5|nr:DUF2934 domain-containing protein [Pseudomonas oryzagri]MCC6074808.1 DUF2934 domain-containing protein [Pseudomonas oryzagri]